MSVGSENQDLIGMALSKINFEEVKYFIMNKDSTFFENIYLIHFFKKNLPG